MRFLRPRPELSLARFSRPDWQRVESRNHDKLWLDKNENLDPDLLQVIAQVQAKLPLESLSTYPDLKFLYTSLAAAEGLPIESILLTTGSDGGIRRVFETFVSPGDAVVLTLPTFAMYPLYVQMFGARPLIQPYHASSAGPVLDWNALIATVEKNKPRLVCLPNPDSPSGTVGNPQQMNQLLEVSLKAESLVLIDEAYYPFYPETLIRHTQKFPNLIVARTFSKAWGLAGLRLGFLAAQGEVHRYLNLVRPMYEIGAYPASFLLEMLSRRPQVLQSVARINQGRDRFQQEARSLGFTTFPSFGNFFHLNLGAARDAHLRKLSEVIYFRAYFSDECLKDYCRISAAPWEILEPVWKILKQS